VIIHIVQPGETIEIIANQYNITIERLILDNGITNPNHLVIGQAIVIVYPEIIHTIQEGDTLASIAEEYDVSVMELLRNNPYLSDREFIYPGENIVIKYETNKLSQFATSGYCYPYIDRDVLIKTLPFLTYITIFNYRATTEGNLIEIDDTEIIQIAKDYGVAPMMFVSTLSEEGIGNVEVAYNILSRPEVQENAINNILRVLETKGYYGLNIYIQYLNMENIKRFEDYIKKLADSLHSGGYRIVLTITPRILIERNEITFEGIDYSNLANTVDGILFLSYEWGFSLGAPGSIAPVNLIKDMLDYAINMVPPEKLFIGLPVSGYDWELPYVPGITRANSVTTEGAIQIAAEYGVPIQYHEGAQAPYFFYMSLNNIMHIVWFKDARSFNAIAYLVYEYGLQGLSIWNIMNYNSQLWLVININYEIEKVL
jgi:spore germination protein